MRLLNSFFCWWMVEVETLWWWCDFWCQPTVNSGINSYYCAGKSTPPSQSSWVQKGTAPSISNLIWYRYSCRNRLQPRWLDCQQMRWIRPFMIVCRLWIHQQSVSVRISYSFSLALSASEECRVLLLMRRVRLVLLVCCVGDLSGCCWTDAVSSS